MSPKETKKLIGQRIKLLRERKGLKLNPNAKTRAQMGRAYSQMDLAMDSVGQDISFTKQQIANYEQGTRTPAPWDAAQLAKLLNASPAYILCLDEGQPILTGGEIDLIMAFRELPLDKRADFISRVCDLAEAYRSARVKIADPAQALHNADSPGTPEKAPKSHDERVKAKADPTTFPELVKIHGEEEARAILRDMVEQARASKKGKHAGDKKSTAGKPSAGDDPGSDGASSPPRPAESGKRLDE
jgi:transcriptional regulator with XRE-family HTH domain